MSNIITETDEYIKFLCYTETDEEEELVLYVAKHTNKLSLWIAGQDGEGSKVLLPSEATKLKDFLIRKGY
jgi:hypothetical protein